MMWGFRIRKAVLLAFAGIVAVISSVGAPAVAQQIMIVAEASEPDVEGALWLAVNLSPDSEYTFWENGLSGLETEWTLPEGLSAGTRIWPTPIARNINGTQQFIFPAGSVFLQELKLADGATLGDGAEIALKAKFAVCAPTCGLTERNGAVRLSVDAAGAPDAADVFATARETTPPMRRSGAFYEAGDGFFDLVVNKYSYDGDRVLRPVHVGAVRSYFLPLSGGLLADDGIIPLEAFVDSGSFNRIPLVEKEGMPFTDFEALFAHQNAEGGFSYQSYRGRNYIGWRKSENQPRAVGEAGVGLAKAILFALIGGMILNIMPCVFPVLAMKALSFTTAATGSKAAIRRDAWAYTGGVLLSFLVVAGTLQGLRAAGAAVGWGFQLQAPAFVYVFALLFFVLGLNLLGFFEMGGRFQALGQSLTERKGSSGSFFTGVLATLVATPCTVPFMAPAIAFALTQSALSAMTIFAALGLGLALPYLVLSYIPAIQRAFPKPGPWMNTFKELLAFPMLAAAIWLVWVLNAQSGSQGVLVALAAALVVTFGLWLKKKLSAQASTIVTVAVLVAAFSPLFVDDALPRMERAQFSTFSPDIGLQPEIYSEERALELRAQGRPVFLHFWAAWCPICLMHERLVFSTPEFQTYLKDNNIVFMEVDNTLSTPENVALLKSFGAEGQPLDVFFPADLGKPAHVMPGLFTTDTALEIMESLNN